MITKQNDQLNTALRNWCKANHISVRNLADKTGYSRQYAYRLLAGSVPVTAETVGVFVLSFGLDAARDFLQATGMYQVSELPHPDGAQVVPVVHIQ
jgi:transcriptional regulator with XRE-family HTH domain